MTEIARLADHSGLSRGQLVAQLRKLAAAGEHAQLSTERLAENLRRAAGGAR